ncbi:DnaD domain protein [Streptococcus iniae]|uniref:Helicase loader n=1 Tax=Streptococcus iniae TaxID=1346 RepID=A0A3L8GDA8_STRIN|nr:DnaD domain protein [Streptococcus iniae]AHY16294.1 helicase loader [Streptococcus iniae]AHY18157.1 helicase loader [Streptococcus iniae]AJG26445.1 helicase loader [Streptococcus iniae]APD32320.1 helicase loader [Streptococcus iniae]ASL35282.1 replicative DNA helicase [Streptococcus iniae]
MMKPINEFYYVQHNKIICNSNNLIQLYLPIIGSDAVSVYQYLTSFFDDGRRGHKFSEILNHLQIGMPRLEEALVQLTAMELLVFYQLPDSYLIKLQPTLDNDVFLANPVYYRLLEQKIGDLAISQLLVSIPKEARNISKRFSDVYGTVIDKQPSQVSQGKKQGVQFDLDSFRNLMNRDGLQFQNEQEDVISLYSLSEQFDMTWFDTYRLAKETAINGKIAPKRILLKKQADSTSAAQSEFTAPEQALIKEAKSSTALQFLEKIKQARRARVTKDERDILTRLAQMDFLDEVINVMVMYTFSKTNTANLQKTYITKIANDFAYQGVNYAEDAILKMRAFADRQESKTTKAKSKASNVPTWSNPNYQEETSAEDQARMDHFKKEALERLNKLKKGGE